MASSDDEKTNEDLSLCPICSKSYNHEDCLPKFLPCHDTLCLQCLKNTVSSSNTVTCPKCHGTFHLSKETISSLPTNIYVLKNVELQNIIKNGPSWCLNCDGSPKASCEQSNHIIADHKNEKEEVEVLLAEILNNFKKAANAREELQNKYLQQRVDHLEAKLNVAKSELSQNSTCLNELKLKIANYDDKKLFPIDNGNFSTGYGSTKKNLKKMLQKAKKEASFSIRFLINHKLLEKSAPSDEDIQEGQQADSSNELSTRPIASTSETPLPSEEEQSANEIQRKDQNASTHGTNLNEMSIISNGSSNNELLIEIPEAPSTKNLGDNLVQIVAADDAAASLSTTRKSSRLSRFNCSTKTLRASTSPYNKVLHFQCDKCDRVYKTRDSLVRHKRVECGKPGTFQCSKCSFTAHYSQQLKKHVALADHDE